MSDLAKALTGLAALAFVVAIVTNFTGPILQTRPEGFSRACTNLALLAIAVVLAYGPPSRAGRSV